MRKHHGYAFCLGIVIFFLSTLLVPGISYVSTKARQDTTQGLPQKGPYLSCVTEGSIVISWRTVMPDSSVVQYGLTSAYGNQAKDTHLKTAHSLQLEGFLPNTVYHYRVLFENSYTPDYSFRTSVSTDTTYHFAVYGDTRTQADSHLAVVNQIVDLSPHFVLHTGDVVANGFSESDWAVYFATVCSNAVCAQEIPFYYAIGNHENESPLYYDYLYLPHNNPDSTESYYSFDYGNSHFISLNTEIPYEPTSAQYQWLRDDLRRTYDKSYVFVFMHQHPYCAGGHDSNIPLRNTLCPLFEDFQVDMVFGGHSHFYQRNGPINGVTYVIAAGGGAPLYAPSESVWTRYSEESHHCVHLTVESDFMKFKMVRSDGNVGDTLTYPARQKLSVCGDVNSDGIIQLGDVIYVINYCLKGDLVPEPSWVGDVNCDWAVDLGDVIFLLNYLFEDGPEPAC